MTEKKYPSADMLGQFAIALQQLGWDSNDELRVDIGGVAVTGTATHPDANPKWAKPFGSITYQKDAFIVIKNVSRNPVVPSQENLSPLNNFILRKIFYSFCASTN